MTLWRARSPGRRQHQQRASRLLSTRNLLIRVQYGRGPAGEADKDRLAWACGCGTVTRGHPTHADHACVLLVYRKRSRVRAGARGQSEARRSGRKKGKRATEGGARGFAPQSSVSCRWRNKQCFTYIFRSLKVPAGARRG